MYSTKEVATTLGVSGQTIRQYTGFQITRSAEDTESP